MQYVISQLLVTATRPFTNHQRPSLGYLWAPETVTRPLPPLSGVPVSETGFEQTTRLPFQGGHIFLSWLAGWLAKFPQVGPCSVVFLFRSKI